MSSFHLFKRVAMNEHVLTEEGNGSYSYTVYPRQSSDLADIRAALTLAVSSDRACELLPLLIDVYKNHCFVSWHIHIHPWPYPFVCGGYLTQCIHRHNAEHNELDLTLNIPADANMNMPTDIPFLPAT